MSWARGPLRLFGWAQIFKVEDRALLRAPCEDAVEARLGLAIGCAELARTEVQDIPDLIRKKCADIAECLLADRDFWRDISTVKRQVERSRKSSAA